MTKLNDELLDKVAGGEDYRREEYPVDWGECLFSTDGQHHWGAFSLGEDGSVRRSCTLCGAIKHD